MGTPNNPHSNARIINAPGNFELGWPSIASHKPADSSSMPLLRVCRLLPPSAAIGFGSLLGRVVFHLAPWRRKVLRTNLQQTRSHRQSSAAADAMLESAAYQHLGRALMLTLHPQVSPSLPVACCDTATIQLRADCVAGGVVICSAHIGVWELLPAVLAAHVPERTRAHSLLVYRPLHDAPLDEWLRRRRTQAAGVILVVDRGSLDSLRQAVELGGAAALLPDQRPTLSSNPKERTPAAPLVVDLLGQRSALSPGLCVLHRSTGAPVWFAALLLHARPPHGPALCLRLARLATRGANELSVRLGQAYANELTEAVEAFPSQYFWWHNRWRQDDRWRQDESCAGEIRRHQTPHTRESE